MLGIAEIDLLRPDGVNDLTNLVYGSIVHRKERECIQEYGSARKTVVDRSLSELGIEKLSIGDVQRLDWNVVESKIEQRISSARVAIAVFANERKYCQMIFGKVGLDDNAPFSQAVKGSALQYFGFAEAIAIGCRSPEKLFKILRLHDSLSDLLPDISLIFSTKSTESIYFQVEDTVSHLAHAIRGILSEFESAVLKDSSRTLVPDGSVHPLTHYVMNYTSQLSEHKPSLTNLITCRPSYRLSSSTEPIFENLDFPQSETETPFDSHLMWIIFILQNNIERKSALYENTALSNFFMMNNSHYIMCKIKESEKLREIIGDRYLRKIIQIFGQAVANYQRTTLTNILNCLRGNSLHRSNSFNSPITDQGLIKRFKAFTASFEETHRAQSLWHVPDTHLKEELRISIIETLLPAYRSFFQSYSQQIEKTKFPKIYIKYSVEDLERSVMNFFEPNLVPRLNWMKSLSRRRSFH